MKQETKINVFKGHEIYFFFVVTVLLILTAIVFTGCAKTGATGAQGSVGAPGQTPTITTLPASAQECPTGGTDVFIGTNPPGVVTTETSNQDQEVTICNGAVGKTGAVGATGSQGETGPAGTNATPVTVVQFCPGVTPTYPSTFPEYGLVIGSNVYGVYSANDGYLAYLPPGEYESNAIGSSCDFTINVDGSISN